MPTNTSTQLKEMVDYCWSHKFLDVFHQFFDEHAEAFEGAPVQMAAGEHNLEYYALFQRYLKLYESTLTDQLKSMSFSPEDFYAEIAELQEQGGLEKSLQLFINCLLASTDYESFYKVMAKQGNQRVMKKAMSLELLKATNLKKAECKSEGKEEYADEKPSAKRESKEDCK